MGSHGWPWPWEDIDEAGGSESQSSEEGHSANTTKTKFLEIDDLTALCARNYNILRQEQS